MTYSTQECAQEVLDTVPTVMKYIRQEMRRGREGELTVPHFRTLLFLRRHPAASLSDVADHIGLSLPSASKMVDILFERGLLLRQESETDRRRVTLGLTSRGSEILEVSTRAARAHLEDLLAGLPTEQRQVVVEAMQMLRGVFAPDKRLEAETIKQGRG